MSDLISTAHSVDKRKSSVINDDTRNRAGFGGGAAAVARASRPALQARLAAALADTSALSAEDRLLAAETLLNQKGKLANARQRELAAEALAALVEDDRVPHGVAIRAGRLLDGLSRVRRGQQNINTKGNT